jgi:hypothetical protein
MFPIGWIKRLVDKISDWIGHPIQLDKTSPSLIVGMMWHTLIGQNQNHSRRQ